MEGELPLDAKMSMAGAHLHLYNVQYEDEGTYECQAVNSKGKDWHRARVSVEGRCTTVSLLGALLYLLLYYYCTTVLLYYYSYISYAKALHLHLVILADALIQSDLQ